MRCTVKMISPGFALGVWSLSERRREESVSLIVIFWNITYFDIIKLYAVLLFTTWIEVH